MKKAKIIILLFICILLPFSGETFVFAASQPYARIVEKNCYLYKTSKPSEHYENKWCILPQTFFVKIISDYNEVFYKVQFGELKGYAKKSDLLLVNETPKTPYPKPQTIYIKKNSSCFLRTSPKDKGAINNTITIMPGGTAIKYIGKIIGDADVDLKGSLWYLVKYENTIGYVYNYYSDTFIPSQSNNEIVTERLGFFTTLNPLSSTANIFLIIVIMCPLAFILMLLYKPRRKLATLNHKQGESNILDATSNHLDPEV